MKTTVKKTSYFFLLEESLYQRLKILTTENNKKHPRGKYHLKLDVLCFFLHLISHREAQAKDISEFGYVPLKAEYLKKYHHAYKIYFDFLKRNGFIKVKTYSILRQQSKRYKIIKPKVMGNFIKHDPADSVLRKKLNSETAAKKAKATKKTGHLTKWLHPDYLRINYEDAIAYITNTKMTESKRYSRRYLIEMLKHGNIYYQREGKDNRLHSILTNLPKDIRCFLRYKESSLVSLDIKSSQPYMLSGILSLMFIERDVDKIIQCIRSMIDRRYRNKISHATTIMIQEIMREQDMRGIIEFINLISKGDIYEYIGQNLSPGFKDEIETPLGITDKFYKEKLGYKVQEHFSTIRDYCKKVMLEYLYCSPSNKEKRYLEVRRILPAVISEVADKLKEEDKNAFPVFLQNAESYLILDYITKKISVAYPEIPLYTIHDSIVTTLGYVDYVEAQLKEDLVDFFGLRPKIEREVWGDQVKYI